MPPRPMPPGLLPGRRWAVNVSDLIFKRQEKARETTIWENGHLTDPKYSNMVSSLEAMGYHHFEARVALHAADRLFRGI